ncbi:methyltransferase N6AMT1-like [Oscarella lobularis]|uniref:methyltransferase N6AMT1-like n=1 Tax=Oscarella lobularis TaxID=121494 RepID=UPI0033139083
MTSTPRYDHVDFQNVYEPAEDTFLLLDALEQETTFLYDLNPSICLEIGCGSGVVLTFLADLLKSHTTALYVGTDINCFAARACRETLRKNGFDGDVIVTDLIHSLLPRLMHKVDVLLFNPPYVITSPDEVNGTSISASWAGGIDGRQVIDRLLGEVNDLLSVRQAVFYLVLVRENKPEEVIDYLQTQGFSVCTILERKAGSEYLSIVRATR